MSSIPSVTDESKVVIEAWQNFLEDGLKVLRRKGQRPVFKSVQTSLSQRQITQTKLECFLEILKKSLRYWSIQL